MKIIFNVLFIIILIGFVQFGFAAEQSNVVNEKLQQSSQKQENDFDESEVSFFKGYTSFIKRDYDEAILLFTQTLQLYDKWSDNNLSRVYYFLGMANKDNGDLSEALEYFKTTLKLNDLWIENNRSLALVQLGDVYNSLQQNNAAIESYASALQSNDGWVRVNFYSVYTKFALAYFSLINNLTSIEGLLSKVDVKAIPPSVSCYLLRENKKNKSFSDLYNSMIYGLSRAISMDNGQHSMAYYLRGAAHFRLGKISPGKIYGDSSDVELDDETGNKKYNTKIGEYQKAIEDFTKVLELKDNTFNVSKWSIYLDRGTCYYKINKQKLSLRNFPCTVIAFFKEHSYDNKEEVSFLLQKAEEDFTSTLNMLSSFGEKNNKHIRLKCYYMRGFMYFIQQEFLKAAVDFQKVVNAGEQKNNKIRYYKANIYLGHICYMSGDYEQAIKYSQAALRVQNVPIKYIMYTSVIHNIVFNAKLKLGQLGVFGGLKEICGILPGCNLFVPADYDPEELCPAVI